MFFPFSFVLIDTGELLEFGNRVGTGLSDDMFFPTPIPFPDTESVASVSCGSFHTAILTERGQCFTFGSNGSGQLGHGDRRDVAAPKCVEGLLSSEHGGEMFIVSVACGGTFTAGLTDEGAGNNTLYGTDQIST